MFGKRKKEGVKHNLQAENIYLVSEIEELDWKSLKLSDTFFDAFFKVAGQNVALKMILDKMTLDGFKIEDAKKTLETRKVLRSKIVGSNDVEALKEEFRLKIEELNELTVDINYYKDKFKKTKKRAYSEQEFKIKTDKRVKLEEWILSHNWIANHSLK